MPITHLGKYKLEGEVGRGSSGIVYRAFDPGVSRIVAIKILAEADKAQLAQFSHKANASGRLNHKNIVNIFEFVADGDIPYLVMEYLDGENLDEIISSGRSLSIIEKVSIMAQVADGLGHAHDNGVVHCDVKPSNIRILPNGTVKILDFGFANASEAQSLQLAREGTLPGTVAYLAPEILQDEPFDRLCDIYSFGVVYFELITGKNPFGSDRDEIARVIYNILASNVLYARSFNQDCPQKLEQLIAKAMLQDRALRYHSFVDLIADHAPILSELQWSEVDTLTQKAELLLASGDSVQAKATVLQAMKLAPGSIPARTLLGKIDVRLQAEERRQRALQLMESGRQELRSLEFARAVRTFENVIDLDPGNKEAEELLARAKGELIKLEQHKMLLAQAEQYLKADMTSEAFQCVQESLLEFPDDSTAAALLDQIQKAIYEQDQRRHLEQRLARVRELVEAGKLEEASTRFAEIELSPQSAAMKASISEVRVAIQDARQRIRLKSSLDEARIILSEGKWSEALSRLRELEVDFSDNDEVQSLTDHAKQQLQLEERGIYIERLLSDVHRANEKFEFDDALDLINKGLKIYANDEELIASLAGTEQLQLAHRKRTSVEAAAERASLLASQDDFSGAITELDSAAETWNTDDLNALRANIEGMRIEYERKQAIDMVCENVRECQRQNRFQDAISVGQEGLTKYPGEPALQELVVDSRKSLEEQQRKQRIESATDNALSRAALGDFDSALKIARDAMRELKEPCFEALCNEIEADRQKWNRREAAAAAVENIQTLIQNFKFAEAIGAGRKAATEFPGEIEFEHLVATAEESLKTQQRSNQVATAEAKSTLLVKQKDFESAISLLRDSIAELGPEPKLETLLASAKALLEEKMKSASIQSTLAGARKLMGSKQLSEAVKLLQEALTRYPGNKLIEALLSEAGALVTARQEAEATEAAIREGRIALKRGDFKTALDLTTHINNKGSKDPRVAVLEAEIKRAMDQDHKDRICRAVLESAQGLENQGRFREAVEVLEKALAEDPSASVVSAKLHRLRETIARQEKVNETMDTACALIAGGLFEEALRFVNVSIAECPDELAYPSLLDEIKRSQRADACTKVCKEIESLRAAGNLDDARASVEKAIVDFQDEPAVEALKSEIEADIAEKNRIELIEGIASEARQLLSGDKVDDAILMLEGAQKKHPGDQGLLALLAESRGILTQRKQILEIDNLVQTFRAFIQDGRVQEALKGLKNASIQYPNEERLQSLLAEITVPAATDGKAETDEQIHIHPIPRRTSSTSILTYLAIAAVLVLAVYLFVIRQPNPEESTKVVNSGEPPPSVVPVPEAQPKPDEQTPVVTTTDSTGAPAKNPPSDPPAAIPNPPNTVPQPQVQEEESVAWNKVNRQSLLELRKFLIDYPSGTYYREADRQVKLLEASLKNFAPTIAIQKADEEAIAKTINDFEIAMKRKDADRIRSIYPGKDKVELDAIFREQKEDIDFRMKYEYTSLPEKDFAEVRGTQIRTINTTRGESDITKKFTARFRRNGSTWVIVSITYGP